MPRRTSPKGKPVNAAGAVLKIVRLELTEDDHTKLRVEAALEGVSMAALARRLVEEHLAKRPALASKPKKGGRS